MSEIKEKKALYSHKEELFNMISHIIGVVLGIVILIMCLVRSRNAIEITGSVIYGLSVIILYACSSYYHGLRGRRSKKVFRVLDHCAIYLLIAGTYSAVAFNAIIDVDPIQAWVIFGVVWFLGILGIVFNAISIEKFKIISMVLNLVMGWVIIGFYPVVIEAISSSGFLLLLIGGLCYTMGAIIYGIGKKFPYFHFIFHILCIAGTLVQFLAIFMYSFN